MVPIVARTTEEMIRLVPHSLREGALALGRPMESDDGCRNPGSSVWHRDRRDAGSGARFGRNCSAAFTAFGSRFFREI